MKNLTTVAALLLMSLTVSVSANEMGTPSVPVELQGDRYDRPAEINPPSVPVELQGNRYDSPAEMDTPIWDNLPTKK